MPVDRRLIDAQGSCRSERAAFAGHSQEVSQVIPVQHALVMQFCTRAAQACCSRTGARIAIKSLQDANRGAAEMWFKCVGVALVVSASALCFPLQAAAQSEYAAPVGTAHSDLQSNGNLFVAQHRPAAFNPRSSIV